MLRGTEMVRPERNSRIDLRYNLCTSVLDVEIVSCAAPDSGVVYCL